MADANERVLISIEIEKPEGEAQIDALTQKITGLQKATADLKKENNELIKAGKENSEQYIENTRQIEVNKQKINESVASRKGLVQTILAEDNSIKALQVRNAELVKERNKLNTATAEGKNRIAEINSEIDKNNEVIVANSSALEKQRFNIGNYGSALKGVSPLLGGFIEGLQGIGNAVKTAFAAFGPFLPLILLIGGAIKAFQAYINGSEEGQNRWNKVVQIGSAILEQFVNVLEDVGEVLFDAFENPKQAAIDLMNFLEDQFVNRIVGMIELIPKLGLAVEQLFQGNFAEAGKIAGDAVGKVVLGIENATDVISDFINETAALIEQGIKNGERIAALQAQIDRDERELIVKRQKDALEVAKLREEALQHEGEERKKVLLEAIALEEQLAAQEVNLAKTRLALAQATLQANGDDKAALKEVAEARAAVFAAEATAFQNTLRFRKELRAIDEEAAREEQKQADELAAIVEKAHEEELKRQEREREAIAATEELRLQTEIDRAASVEERVEHEIELEQFKAFTLLENEALLESERQLIIEQSQKKINDIIVKGTAERVKKEEAEEKKLADVRKQVQRDYERGAFAAANAAVGFAREAFGESKGVAIAQATINTIQGVVRALSDYVFPYSLIVGALVGAAGAIQIGKIASTNPAARGMIIPRRYGYGGIARTGGLLRGPLHRDGGIPFTVRGHGGFEAEGDEAIINRRSTRMYRPLLSAINQAGGGVAFDRGGVTRFQTGAIIGSQTSLASQQSESRTLVRDAVLSVMENMPPIVTVVTDINERQAEVAENTLKANII